MYKFSDKKSRFVAKEYDSEGNFLHSVVMPTDRYPLPAPEYRVFTKDNTAEVTEERILKTVDLVPYQPGLSFSNVRLLAAELKKADIPFEAYMGWKFLRGGGRPMHHAWIMVGGNQLLDLTDDEYLYELNIGRAVAEQELDPSAMNADDWRELRLSFMKSAAEWPNSRRCEPLGKIFFPDMLYIGVLCDPLESGGRFS